MTNVICKLVTVICFLTSVFKKTMNDKVKNQLRIIGGSDLPSGKYEYVVILASIRDKIVYRKCTGSMISNKWALTAAHCVESYKTPGDLEYMYIWYKNLTVVPIDTRFYSKILEVMLHPHYVYSYNNGQIDLNDISLARVRNVDLTSYGKLLATDYQSLIGTEVLYMGGGQVHDGPFTPKDEIRPLQVGKGVILACEGSFLDKISYPLICVAPKCVKKQSACYGDAGGPLISPNSKIVGIMVTLHPILVAAYVPVSPYLDWIFNTIDAQKNKVYNKNNNNNKTLS